LAGATPVFADIDPVTFNILPEKILVTERTKAIMPVHLYGLPAAMLPIRDIARENELVVIEDACQAFGSAINQMPIGSTGTACFSLYATKNITTGEGGMIVTDDEDVYEQCRLLRNHGMRSHMRAVTVGYNYRMNEIQAAIGLCQLSKARELLYRRHAIATKYLDSISTHKVLLPFEPSGYTHSFHLFTVRVPTGRDKAASMLSEKGIETGVYYNPPLNQQPTFWALCEDMPSTDKAAKEVLSIPVHPGLTDEDVDKIIGAVDSL